jgi:hypothetical protein
LGFKQYFAGHEMVNITLAIPDQEKTIIVNINGPALSYSAKLLDCYITAYHQ